MARALRASVALSALALSAFAGVAAAAPKADNPNAGPPPSITDPCLDIVDGGGNLVVDQPVAGSLVDSATVHFTMFLNAPSCPKGQYTLNVFNYPLRNPVDTSTVVPSAIQLGSETVKGNGTTEVAFVIHITDPTMLDPTGLWQDPTNQCVDVQGVTTGRGGTADTAPDTNSVPVCVQPPALAGFH